MDAVEQPARGSDREYCSAHPGEQHHYASRNITEHQLTHRTGLWYRMCTLCQYVDLSEVATAIDKLIGDRDQTLARTNVAARLSAEARDQADDLRRQIGELNEQIATLETDRLDNDAWAVHLTIRADIQYEQGGDPYEAIDGHIGKLTTQLRNQQEVTQLGVLEGLQWLATDLRQSASIMDYWAGEEYRQFANAIDRFLSGLTGAVAGPRTMVPWFTADPGASGSTPGTTSESSPINGPAGSVG